jgi:dihydroorotate dehydrogenase electron transfer subunit
MTEVAERRTVPLSRLPESGPFAPDAPAPVLLDARIAAHRQVGPEYWRLTLDAPAIASRTRPGQFVMLTIARPGEPAPVLPRPMAIFGSNEGSGTVDVVYRVVGEGTHRMSTLERGQTMVTVGPLGRSFVLDRSMRRIVLLGRGIGTCSLTALGTEACRRGIEVIAVASGRHPDAIIGPDDYRAAGARDVVAVVDSDASSSVESVGAWLEPRIADGVDELFVCGSSRLLGLAADVADRCGAGVQVSLEAHMACGLGFCHGCAAGRPGLPHETPLVCADGPVFRYPSPAPTGRAATHTEGAG